MDELYKYICVKHINMSNNFTHLLTHLDCFCILVIMHNAAVNMGMQVSLPYMLGCIAIHFDVGHLAY